MKVAVAFYYFIAYINMISHICMLFCPCTNEKVQNVNFPLNISQCFCS